MDIYSGAVLISLIINIAVGNYAGRRVKKLDDYFVAGRRAPTLLIVGTLVASVLSTNIFLGETGFVYEGQAGPYLPWLTFSGNDSTHNASRRPRVLPLFSVWAATCWPSPRASLFY